ncbi:hypothetical protein T4B_2895 [Trichinella pseudospiralis]|uniref:Uncharacterized protein n=1 Tax=Trichinella pseudospiralis TaxID=6337 RepID=A0A0V1II15_TRIPS|nr:hypothetical protein T4B_2895 [Trichinella pseudospiralis]
MWPRCSGCGFRPMSVTVVISVTLLQLINGRLALVSTVVATVHRPEKHYIDASYAQDGHFAGHAVGKATRNDSNASLIMCTRHRSRKLATIRLTVGFFARCRLGWRNFSPTLLFWKTILFCENFLLFPPSAFDNNELLEWDEDDDATDDEDDEVQEDGEAIGDWWLWLSLMNEVQCPGCDCVQPLTSLEQFGPR